jgi:hypothetical protein
MARDRVGWNLSKQAASNLQEYIDSIPRGSSSMRAMMDKAIDYTYWAIFAMTSSVSLALTLTQ